MLEPLDEETLSKFDDGKASDHEIKMMLIVKIQELIDYVNSITIQISEEVTKA